MATRNPKNVKTKNFDGRPFTKNDFKRLCSAALISRVSKDSYAVALNITRGITNELGRQCVASFDSLKGSKKTITTLMVRDIIFACRVHNVPIWVDADKKISKVVPRKKPSSSENEDKKRKVSQDTKTKYNNNYYMKKSDNSNFFSRSRFNHFLDEHFAQYAPQNFRLSAQFRKLFQYAVQAILFTILSKSRDILTLQNKLTLEQSVLKYCALDKESFGRLYQGYVNLGLC